MTGVGSMSLKEEEMEKLEGLVSRDKRGMGAADWKEGDGGKELWKLENSASRK